MQHRNSTSLSPVAIGTTDTFPKIPRQSQPCGGIAAAGAAELGRPAATPLFPNKAWDYRGAGRAPFPFLENVGERASKETRGGDSDDF